MEQRPLNDDEVQRVFVYLKNDLILPKKSLFIVDFIDCELSMLSYVFVEGMSEFNDIEVKTYYTFFSHLNGSDHKTIPIYAINFTDEDITVDKDTLVCKLCPMSENKILLDSNIEIHNNCRNLIGIENLLIEHEYLMSKKIENNEEIISFSRKLTDEEINNLNTHL